MSSATPIAPTPVAAVVRQSPSARRRLGRLGWNAAGIAVFVVMVFPVYWMVSTAFKTGPNIFSYSPKWLPVPATLANFGDAIHRQYFWQNVRNSLIVVGVVVVLSLTLAFLAALALAKFKFYGRRAFIVLIIAVQMVPLNALIIPLYITLSRAHQVNKLSGVIITYMTFVLPFTIWTLRGFILGVPRELEEAAMVDGTTRFGAFVLYTKAGRRPRWWYPAGWPAQGGIPPAFAPRRGMRALSASDLCGLLNDRLAKARSASFTANRGTAWGPLMAGATLTALPVVGFFLLVQRRIAFGLTAGAVRG